MQDRIEAANPEGHQICVVSMESEALQEDIKIFHKMSTEVEMNVQIRDEEIISEEMQQQQITMNESKILTSQVENKGNEITSKAHLHMTQEHWEDVQCEKISQEMIDEVMAGETCVVANGDVG